jgi:Spy/CpxP family protein refolding chaperone
MHTPTNRFHRVLAQPAGRVALTLALALGGMAMQVAQAAPEGPGMRGMHGDHAGGPGGFGMMGGGRHMDRLLDSVNATPDQRTQIQAIVKAAQADMKAQREAGRSLHQQSQALFTQPTVDARAAEALRQQMLALHDQVTKQQLQVMLDISRVLSPEQRQKAAELMAQRRAMMEQRRGAASAPAAGK